MKSDVLTALGLHMLVGTFFEDAMTVETYSDGDEIIDFEEMRLGACYILQGLVEGELYTVEGKQFFRYYEEGDSLGIGESIQEHSQRQKYETHGVTLKARGEVRAVYLPFKILIDRDYPQKAEAVTRIALLIAEEKSAILSYCLGKAIYNDEEFLLKAFEKRRYFDVATKDLAKGLNMNVRNLQRYLKKFEELGIIKREGTRVSVSDEIRFREYMKKYVK